MTQSGSLAAAFQSLPVQVGAKTGSAQVDGEETSNAVLVCFCPLRGPGDRPGRGGGAGRVRLLPGHRGRPGDPGVRAVTPNPRPWEQAG